MTAAAVLAKPAGDACAKCPGREARCVLPEAPRGAVRLAIVGEAPGRNEVREGRPFIGASGRMLEAGLRTIGLTRANVHWTNAVLCDVEPKALPAARKACAARLRAELQASGASVIMPVGAMGLHSTMQLPKRPQILRWRGSVNPLVWPASGGSTAAQPVLVCPTIHPAFVMRAEKWAPVLEIDVERIGRVLADGWQAPEEAPGRRIVVARSIESLERFASQLATEDLGFDVETVGLGPTETRLVCFALSDGMLTLVVPWAKASNGLDSWWSDPRRVSGIVSNVLRDRIAVTHNGPAFDHIVAGRYGIKIARWDDTLLAAHATESHLPKNLAHVVTMGLDVAAWKQQEDRGADLDRLWVYNGRDTLYTILRWRQLRPLVLS